MSFAFESVTCVLMRYGYPGFRLYADDMRLWVNTALLTRWQHGAMECRLHLQVIFADSWIVTLKVVLMLNVV